MIPIKTDMQESYIIIGLSPITPVFIDIAHKQGKEVTGIIDLHFDGNATAHNGIQVLGGPEELKNYPKGTVKCIVALENNQERRVHSEFLSEAGYELGTLIHPAAHVADSVRIGKGSVIQQGAQINVLCELGNACIVGMGAVVDHDCVLGHYSFIGAGTVLGRTVELGNESYVGIGAVVVPEVKIGQGCTVYSGAVLTEHVSDGQSSALVS